MSLFICFIIIVKFDLLVIITDYSAFCYCRMSYISSKIGYEIFLIVNGIFSTNVETIRMYFEQMIYESTVFIILFYIGFQWS
jgi:hypothetical protein